LKLEPFLRLNHVSMQVLLDDLFVTSASAMPQDALDRGFGSGGISGLSTFLLLFGCG
jgi:hypothetical protein